MKTKELLKDIFLRYFIAILLGFPGIYLIYLVFSPLTIYPAFFILSLFYPGMVLANNIISYGDLSIIIISACIAGSAYYLLLALNLTTTMKIKKRVYSLLFLIISFLVLNILRLVIFSSLFISGYEHFDIAHKSFWYFGSIGLVAILWFVTASLFKIKSIPFYTDFKNLDKLRRRKKR